MPEYTLDNTKVTTWFERDRGRVALVALDDTELVAWLDGAIDEAVETGYLKIKTVLGKVMDNGGPELHQTALAYYDLFIKPQVGVSIKPNATDNAFDDATWLETWNRLGDDMPCPDCGEYQVRTDADTDLTECLECGWHCHNESSAANSAESAENAEN